jgi:mRNA degradation ribonuclease J1/J2
VQVDQHSRITEEPQIFQQGVIYEPNQASLLEIAAKTLAEELASNHGDNDPAVVRRTTSTVLGRFWKDQTGRRPVILPILVEV